jgi:AcrR family transcriptional regulator
MSRPVRPFLGESADSRVSTRRRQLVDRAYAMMASNTWNDCTIVQLCREAGLNKRYFYESFATLDALENAVVDDLTETLLATGWRAVGEAGRLQLDTAALARHVLDACVTWLVDDPHRATVLFRRMSNNPQARTQHDQVIKRLAQVLSAFGTTYHQPRNPGVVVTPRHQSLATLGAALLLGGTIESILFWLDGEIALSKDDFVSDVARLWVSLGDSAVSLAIAD